MNKRGLAGARPTTDRLATCATPKARAFGRAAALLMAGIGLLSAGTANAHHGIAGEFDQSKMTTIHGVISKVSWINPHIYMTLDSKAPGGQPVKYQLESVPVAFARKAGITKEELLNGGKAVDVLVMPARRDPKLFFGVVLKYSDGHTITFRDFKE